MAVAAAPVGDETFAAVFYTVFEILVVAAAVVAKGVERAVAEKAVEILPRDRVVTGETFAFRVLEKGIVFAVPVK